MILRKGWLFFLPVYYNLDKESNIILVPRFNWTGFLIPFFCNLVRVFYFFGKPVIPVFDTDPHPQGSIKMGIYDEDSPH